MTVVRVDGDELVILAGGKELVLFAVDGETSGTSTGRKLPGGCDLLLSSVDTGDRTERWESHKDIAAAVCYSGAWTSGERDGRGDLVGCGVDDGHRMTVRVEGEDGLCGWVEGDGCGDAA